MAKKEVEISDEQLAAAIRRYYDGVFGKSRSFYNPEERAAQFESSYKTYVSVEVAEVVPVQSGYSSLGRVLVPAGRSNVPVAVAEALIDSGLIAEYGPEDENLRRVERTPEKGAI